MDMPDRIAEPQVRRLSGIGGEKREILVDRLRDDVEIEALRRLRLLVHVERQALRRGVGEPLLDGDAVPLGLRDLLRVLVEEQFVVEAFRRLAAEHLADPARELHRIDQVLAGHFVVDAERRPAERPVGLPLALDPAAGDRRLDQAVGVGIAEDDGPGGDVPFEDRHLQHRAGGRADRQERRVALLALLAEARQHDRHHLVVGGEHLQQRRVEAAGPVVVGGARELVGETEVIEKAAEPRIVVAAETVVLAEGIGDAGERLVEMGADHLLVGDVVGNLAQAVEVVGETEHAGRHPVLGEDAKRGPHHGRAGDLAERADMGQARTGRSRSRRGRRRSVGGRFFMRSIEPARLLERPGLRTPRGLEQFVGQFDGGRGDVRQGWSLISEGLARGTLGSRGGGRQRDRRRHPCAGPAEAIGSRPTKRFPARLHSR